MGISDYNRTEQSFKSKRSPGKLAGGPQAIRKIKRTAEAAGTKRTIATNARAVSSSEFWREITTLRQNSECPPAYRGGGTYGVCYIDIGGNERNYYGDRKADI